ncbi:AzlC family ABC transporter permease [Limnohabitans sp. B9-3]|uniref:AzlC family ABC transporter permease n=1 Tax=Limnohabitans sp. B9-3 TaxID=1100707 RepID=UPI000C1EAC73|nr:AzlC family ABC transporter permease [Limnohabitans sp. B9-3]PIT71747.1 branched-chain amino acid ABC transporter permease [Limnohabitans sp. B9-3]
MFLSPKLYRHPEFKIGLHELAPQAMGVAAWGLMTGVAMVKSGMSIVESVFMTLVVFAGSSQLASIPLIVAGAPAWVILATGFCVNLRFVVFSLHLRPHLIHLPRWERLMHAYVTADISYVLFTKRFHKPGATPEERLGQEAYLAGSDCLNWSGWMVASLLGIALAHGIPTEWGLGFAGILCLVGVQCSLASSRLRMVSAAVAGVAAVVAYALPLKLNIVVAIAAAVILCMTLERFKPTDPTGVGT